MEEPVDKLVKNGSIKSRNGSFEFLTLLFFFGIFNFEDKEREMKQADRERLASENHLAAIEEARIRAEIEIEAQLIPKTKIMAFLEKAREKARSSFYISEDGKWAFQSNRSYERVYFNGVLVLELRR